MGVIAYPIAILSLIPKVSLLRYVLKQVINSNIRI